MPFLITLPLINTPILLAIYFSEYLSADPARATSLLFPTFIFLELVIALNCRSLRFTIFKALPHKLLIIAVLWEAILLTILISIPASGEALHIVPLILTEIGLIALICRVVFILIEVVKKFIVMKRISWSKLQPPAN